MWTDLPGMMLVDMNSFFASVEQQANPHLRGRPIGVCASLHETAAVIGTSREAKAKGLRNGLSARLARKICPEIVLLSAEPEKYRAVNRQMVRIFSDYTDRLEVYSIDEAFLDLSESRLNPLAVGEQIKRRIRQEAGEWLTCSVGIAPNKFLCKLAADLQKPDGLSVIWRENLREIYRQKQLKDLWGLGRGWVRRLERLGIARPEQLLDYPVQNLISVFGKPGYYLWQRVNGLEEDELGNGRAEPKSFGHSWILNFRTTDKERLRAVVLRLAEKAAERMRRAGFVAQEIYISIRLVDGASFRRSKHLKFRVDTGQRLYEEVLSLWAVWRFRQPVMHLAVGFASLRRRVDQLALFPDRTVGLTPVIDELNRKYGEFTVRSALLTQTQDYAPDAIAFGQ